MWYFQDKEFDEIPEGSVGFVYRITRDDGKFYVGRKQFHMSKLLPKTKTRKRKKRVTEEGPWREYESSCVPLKDDIAACGRQHFTFEILEVCDSKIKLNYGEVKWQIMLDVLHENTYNSQIAGKWFKGKV